MHPSLDELSGYAFGTLNEDLVEAVAAHVEGCSACEDTVRNFEATGDDVLANLRHPAREDASADEAGCERVMALIDAIGQEPSFAETRLAGMGTPQAPVNLGQVRVYRLLTKLGQGGMGAVYKALHTELDKIVALKVLPADRMQDRAAVDRFKREMKAVGKLEHPNLVRAMDAGEEAGTHYLVMELVDGIDLGALVKERGPLPISEACEIMRQAALGLQQAHKHGLVHRDIKPSNLMLTRDGGVKVLDMGLALLAGGHIEGGHEITTTGQIMGTLDYMAPEQGSDTHRVDIRADLYSVGATLYKLLTGRAPFEGPQFKSAMVKLMALGTQVPQPVRELRPEVPQELSAIIHALLAKSPDDRPATAGDVAQLLAPFASSASLSELFQPMAASAATKTLPESDRLTAATIIAETVTSQQIPSVESKAGRGDVNWKRRWVWTAAAGLIFLAAGIVFQVQFNQGTLIVEILDDSVTTQLTSTGLLVRNTATNREYHLTFEGESKAKMRLPPGTYAVAAANHLVITDDAGASMTGQTFELARGKERLLRITAAAPQSRKGFALHLDDLNYVQLPLRYDGSHPITIEMWCTPAEAELDPESHSYLVVFGALALKLTENPKVWTSTVTRTDTKILTTSAQYYPALLSSAGGAGRRFHLAAQWDRISLNMFVDGHPTFVSVENQDPAAAASQVLQQFQDRQTKPEFFTIGRGPIEKLGDTDKSFHGEINAIRISKANRYRGEFTPPKLFVSDEETLALYKCDEGGGTQLMDSSGHGHHAELRGATWVKVPDPVDSPSTAPPRPGNYALQFSTPRDYVQLPLRYDGSHPLTIEAWCTPNVRTMTESNPIVKFGAFGLVLSRNWGWTSNIFDHESLRVLQRRSMPFAFESNGPSPTRFHLAGQWNGKDVSLFVNGKIATDSDPAEPNVAERTKAISEQLQRQGKYFCIGRGNFKYGANANSSFQGTVDEVRISDVERYTEEFTPVPWLEPDANTIALYHCDEGRGDFLLDSSGHDRNGILVGPTWLRQDAPTPDVPPVSRPSQQ